MTKKKVINKTYWDNFYKIFTFEKPSNFARFVKKKIKKSSSILDIGCGNGRDTFFFIKYFSNTVGIDKSIIAIKYNKLKFKNNFFHIDICKKNNFFFTEKFDNIYARFFLHAISEKDQEIFFSNIKKLSKKNTMIFLEFRTTKDPMFKIGKKISKYERISSHYRRFIDLDIFESFLNKRKYKIVYKKNSFNFANYKKQKPHICRMIIKSKI